MIDLLEEHFPKFANALRSEDLELEEVLPGASSNEIAALERSAGFEFPSSYKKFLSVTRGFWLMGGLIQFGAQHPFAHDFPKREELSAAQMEVVEAKGGGWPPPSNGMLCFAEYFRDADGDQVLFDTTSRSQGGNWPVVYYAHEDRPPSVTKVADSFRQWLEDVCLQQMR